MSTLETQAESRRYFGPELKMSTIWPALLLGLITLILYWPTTHAAFFCLDDGPYIQNNPFVKGGLTWVDFCWALTNPIIGNWHPLTMWSYMLDEEFYGLNPGGFHLTNIIVHAVDTVLVFLVFFRLTGARGRSWVVAALFGLHPLHVESVAWVAERKDVLSAFFWLLTLWAYIRYVASAAARRPDTNKWFNLALLSFVLGLMSKAMLVTLPFVLLLLDFWPLARHKQISWRELVLDKMPFFGLTIVASAITFLVQQKIGAMAFGSGIPLPVRLENALVAYCQYLGKLAWPEDLAFFYPHPKHLPLGSALLAGLVLGLLTVLFYLRRQRQPYLLIGWLWFVGTLVPVIGLVQVGDQAFADRYTYIPSLGIFVAVVWGVYEFTGRWRFQRLTRWLLSAVVLAFFTVRTAQQIPYWRDAEAICRHAIAVTQNNHYAYGILGRSFLEQDLNQQAIPYLQEAIRLKPDYSVAHYCLGLAYFNEYQSAAAIAEFQKTIALQPAYAAAHYNLSAALFSAGQVAESMKEYQVAARLDPQYADGLTRLQGILDLNNLAWQLATSPNPADRNGARAVELAENICNQTQFKITRLVGTLAAAYAEAGRFDEAVTTAQKACLLADRWGDTSLLQINRQLLEIYLAGKPFHQSAPGSH
jgi:protein O-mannosyl-transferase